MCVVPTLTFDLLFAFLVLGHGRRQLLWFEVTRHPTAEWLARQITEAFPWASAPIYLVRDNTVHKGPVSSQKHGESQDDPWTRPRVVSRARHWGLGTSDGR